MNTKLITYEGREIIRPMLAVHYAKIALDQNMNAIEIDEMIRRVYPGFTWLYNTGPDNHYVMWREVIDEIYNQLNPNY